MGRIALPGPQRASGCMGSRDKLNKVSGRGKDKTMVINNDCVRDIMFTIEEESSFEHPCRMTSINRYPLLVKYEIDVLKYHLRYLTMKEFLFMPNKDDDLGYDLTPAGHEFIQNIRNDNNWNKVKKISSKIGFASLEVISAIAQGVATAAINSQLGFLE